ncbi:MAG: putative toxin-antitoxin system toxin component, PIN family [Verrucomicrobia bacterium]|nr:putative toxin-antitoxin system toxin component, PIN family [Verrucomicrobiota bacterium]
MSLPKIVIDTNVFVSALRSKRGASFRLVSLIGRKKFDLSVSVPLVLEYEKASKSFRRSNSCERLERCHEYN